MTFFKFYKAVGAPNILQCLSIIFLTMSAFNLYRYALVLREMKGLTQAAQRSPAEYSANGFGKLLVVAILIATCLSLALLSRI